MKKTAIFIAFIAIATSSCKNAGTGEDGASSKKDTTNTVPHVAQTVSKPMDSVAIAKQTEDEINKWKASFAIGPMHKMMASWDGTWLEEITIWLGEGVPGDKTTGTCENKMILGGRYQQSVQKGTLLKMPYEGIGTLGYDNTKKLFVNSWVDNLGTGITEMEGPYDSVAKTITLKGKVIDPVTGKEKNVTEIMKIVDANHQAIEMYEPSANGKLFKSMAITFTRK